MHQNRAILCGCGGDFYRSPEDRANFFEAPRCAISSAKKIASEPRFLLRIKWVKMALAAEFPAIPSSAAKIASERRCAILVHSAKLRIWTLRIWGFRGPGSRSARQVLCGDAPRLCLDHFAGHLSSVLGRTELCHKVRDPGPQKPPNHLQRRPTTWHCSIGDNVRQSDLGGRQCH